jgi:endonuclease/exonuclease/phosphatase family metal-dependent hydrolase
VVRDRSGQIVLERPELLDVGERTRLLHKAEIAAELSANPEWPGHLWTCDSGDGKWVGASKQSCAAAAASSAGAAGSACGSFKVVTFNVWFAKLVWKARCDAFAELITLQEDADVVCMQEATPRFLARLLARRDIQERYWCTDSGEGETVAMAGYGCCTLVRKASKLPPPTITWVALPSMMGRKALVATFSTVAAATRGGEEGGVEAAAAATVAVATVHLESLNSQRIRAEQLGIISQALERHSIAVLVGDFNITATGPWANAAEHAAVGKVFPGYVDLWVREHGNGGDLSRAAGGDPQALTFHGTINTMLKAEQGTGSPDFARYDRVMVKHVEVRVFLFFLFPSQCC